jgi:hypothetical protein
MRCELATILAGNGTRRRAAIAAFAFASLVGVAVVNPEIAHADTTVVVPTDRIFNPDGSVGGFRSNEPGLYFLVASGWTSEEQNGLPAADLVAASDGTPDAFDLRLTLRPDYSKNTTLVAEQRGANPKALFFPLPSAVQEVTLFLPDALGSVQAQLTPDSGISTSVAMYYRLRFDAAQLEALRILAHGGVTLQGAVTYAYATASGTEETTAPLTVRIPEAALAHVSTATPSRDATQWLSDLLTSTELYLPGSLDGRYALGAGISITMRDSLVRGHVLPGSYSLENPAPRIVLTPSAPVNFRGSIRVFAPELNFTLSVTYDASLAMTLDLETMRVQIDAFELKNVSIAGVNSPFYAQLLRTLVKERSFAVKVSNALSSELQRRILSQTLFGLEPSF